MHCLMCAMDKPMERIYDFSIRQTVMLVWDSDTNCAMLGAGIGAFFALSRSIQRKYLKLMSARG